MLKPSLLKANKRFSDLTFAAAAHAYAGVIQSWIADSQLDLNSTLFYTFWFDFPTAALALLSQRIGLRYVSRAHFFDVYSDRAITMRRNAVARSLGVFCVGEAGCEHLKRQAPDSAEKISLFHLGSRKATMDVLSDCHKADEDSLTFLSVARVAAVKRVQLNYKLLRALAIGRPSTTIRWIHVGDGPLMSILRRDITIDCPKNLIIELKGAVRNDLVQKLYTEEAIDWTMLLSEGEGLPITVCESLSYGVPVVATMVAGTDEVVDDDCGLLLPADSEPEEFVRGILPYLDGAPRFKVMRQRAFARWQENFDAAKLRHEFAEMLQNL